MGKVRDDVSTGKSGGGKPTPKGGGRRPAGWLSSFLRTLLSGDAYKPLQGRQARLWTALGLGAIFLIGSWQVYDAMDGASLPVRSSVGLGLAAALCWGTYRLVNHPPFADFLIATEAEMNKVSWISRDDLKKATAVVLTTVLLVSILLFGVDFIWMKLLQLLHVLQVQSSGFGSTA